MNRDHARNIRRMTEHLPGLLASRPQVTWWIGVMSRFGGHGDWLVECAFARAAKRYWQARLPEETVGVVVLGIECQLPEDIDVAATQPDVDACLRMGGCHWIPRAHAFRPFTNVCYETQIAVKTTFKDPVRWAREQHEADARLSDFRWFYDGFPDSSARAHELGMTEFELLAASSGIPVTADDLAISLDVPNLPDCAAERVGDLDGYAGCVTIHNGQGEGRGTKLLPPSVPEAIARAVARRALVCVQLGLRHPKVEPPIMGAVDLRGLRFPETARVLKGARLHVDIEGALVKMAHAVGTRSVVFFGPTPPNVFAIPGNVNYTRGICPRPWGPHCFWKKRGWNLECPLGFERRVDRSPYDARRRPALCMNHPQPETAVRVVLEALDALDKPPPPAIRVE